MDVISILVSGQMVKKLTFTKGALVVMTLNHNRKEYKEDGLVNGAKGYIDYIQTSENDPQNVKVIWAVFRNKKSGSKVYKWRTNHLRPSHNDEVSKINKKNTCTMQEWNMK